MDIIRRLLGAGDTYNSLSKEGDSQDRMLLSGQDRVDQDFEEEQTRSGRQTQGSARPWARWAVSTLLFGLYSVLLTAYVNKRQSDALCGKQLSVWCK